jgi:hypothetical protein
VPGYVLLASSTHQRSLRAAVSAQGHDVSRFIRAALTYLERRLGPLTFWEHGSPHDPRLQRSSCIVHAHLHVAPGSLALPEPVRCTSFPTLEAALEAGSEARDGYSLLGWSARHVMVGADPRVSQYYRREWARLVGREDEWDYLIAEDSFITAATLRLLAPGRGDI